MTMHLDELASRVQSATLAAPDLATGRARDAAAVHEYDRVGRRPVCGRDSSDDPVGHLAPCRHRVARDLADNPEPLAQAVIVAECRASVRMQRLKAQLFDGGLEVLRGIVDAVLDDHVFGSAGDVQLAVDDAAEIAGPQPPGIFGGAVERGGE